jgi:hypothetical protein
MLSVEVAALKEAVEVAMEREVVEVQAIKTRE